MNTNTNTTKAPTKAQADLLRTIARASKNAPAPVSGRYARTVKVLAANGWVKNHSGNLYTATKAGTALLADDATPAKAQHANVPVDALTGKGKAAAAKVAPTKGKAASTKAAPAKASDKATTGDLRPVGGVQHPAKVMLDLLAKAGLSQTKAATEMGVAPMTLNRLCNGHGLPTARVTVAFARAVGASPEQVWRGVCDYELAVTLRDAK